MAAKKIIWAVVISQLDNEVTALESEMKVTNSNDIKRHREILEDGLQEEPKYLTEKNLELCCALVDYICAVVVRILTQSGESKSYQTSCIAVLSKFATKLKILCTESVKYARCSLDRFEELKHNEVFKALYPGMPSVQSNTYLGEDFEEKKSEGKTGLFVSAVIGTSNSKEDDQRITPYALEMFCNRSVVHQIIKMILEGLTVSSVSGFPVNAFEISSLAYQVGFRDSPALLSQSRAGEIAVTSSPSIICRCFIAFSVLHQTALSIQKRHIDTPPGPPQDCQDSGSKTTIHWDWEKKASESTGSLTLQEMQDVITLAVPLICTCPRIGEFFTIVTLYFNSLVSAKEQIPERPPADFTTLWYLKTAAYDEENAGPLTEDVKPLSKCLMAQHRLLALEQGVDISTGQWEVLSAEAKSTAIAITREKFKKLEDRIDKEWTVDQMAIIVPCRRYALFVALICLILIMGGLIMGFTIHDRIAGVDPFQLASFCWLLAAFVILIAKSIRVENWPWRDFLLGRVVCRSLSELCSVISDVDAQHIITYLLHNERFTSLATRGPYNKPFLQRNRNGFSIDVKIELKTLLLSGIIVLKVMSEQGSALVCINLNNIDDIDIFYHKRSPSKSPFPLPDIICIDLDSKGNKQDATLIPKHLRWTRVLGLYDEPRRLFR